MALVAITDVDEPLTGLGLDYMNRKTGRFVYWGVDWWRLGRTPETGCEVSNKN